MAINITLIRSPKNEKKFRVVLPNGKTVDFGQMGYSDFTLHKTPKRMRSYVQRHGGAIPKTTTAEKSPLKITERMLRVTRSDKEDWGRSGLDTAGFWSRWLLWSRPSIPSAIRVIEEKFGVTIRDARGK